MKANFWREFPTKQSVFNAVREIVNPVPMQTAFTSSLISDLIAERHFFHSAMGNRPIAFRKDIGIGDYEFKGFFNSSGGWQKVSWRKAIEGEPDVWKRLVKAARKRIVPAILDYKSAHLVCERCNAKASAEIHHARPAFIEIMRTVAGSITEADIDSALEGWNYETRDDFTLPEHARFTRLFDSSHENAKLEALCIDCHNATKKKS